MYGAHHLTAPSIHTSSQKQSIKVDAFIAQWVALVNTDHGLNQTGNVLFGRESRPCQWIFSIKCLNAITYSARIVMQVEQNAVIFR